MNELTCSLCGLPESEDEHGFLTDLDVTIAQSEEGFSSIRMYLCSTNNHLNFMTTKLMELGFKDHHHGGINYLEDEDCPDGYENCNKQSEGIPWDGPFVIIHDSVDQSITPLQTMEADPDYKELQRLLSVVKERYGQAAS